MRSFSANLKHSREGLKSHCIYIYIYITLCRDSRKLCRDNHNMKLVELCRDKNAYVATNYFGINIIRQENFVVTWKTLSQQLSDGINNTMSQQFQTLSQQQL